MQENTIKLSVPLEYRRGSLRKDEKASILSGFKTLKYIEQLVDKKLGDTALLDFGCGVKFAQALLQFDVEIKSYVGLDVYREMINFLQESVNDPRLNFKTVDFQNDMYNQDGEIMSVESVLPVGSQKFDLVTMQSVITHFNPSDTKTIFGMLKKYLANDAKVFFTCFVDNTLDQGFHDKHPDSPLLRAIYRQDFMEEMIEESGYNILSFNTRNSDVRVSDHYVIQVK